MPKKLTQTSSVEQSALEAKAGRIAKLALELMSEIRQPHSNTVKTPIHLELLRCADLFAAKRDPNGEVKGHRNQPPVRWSTQYSPEMLDYLSDAHLKDIFHGVLCLRKYARTIVLAEKKRNPGESRLARDVRKHHPEYNPALTKNQRKVLEIDARYASYGKSFKVNDGAGTVIKTEIKFAKGTSIAFEAHVTESFVSKLRKDPVYTQEIQTILKTRQAKKIVDRMNLRKPLRIAKLDN